MFVWCPRTPHPGVARKTSCGDYKIDVFDVNVCQRRLQAHLRALAAANDLFEDAMGWHSMTEEDLKLVDN